MNDEPSASRAEQRCRERFEVVPGPAAWSSLIAAVAWATASAARPASGWSQSAIGIGHECLEAERLTVTARSVAAAFPENLDELWHGILSQGVSYVRNKTDPYVVRS